MEKKIWLNIWIWLLCAVKLSANNIHISNVDITGNAPASSYALVTFDLSWDNSWRDQTRDAAWIFVKYRVSGGEWKHAYLDDTGHDNGTGTDATIETGMKKDKEPFNATTNPVTGVLVYRSTPGRGFSAQGIKLRWNYGANGIFQSTDVEVKVFGIEMVQAGGGPFYAGAGGVCNLRRAVSPDPFMVSETGDKIVTSDPTFFDDSQLEGDGIWLDGDEGISRSTADMTDMNLEFPTGYRGFYCMKYEISQGQYRDFLNTLTREQQNQRVSVNILGTGVTNRYVMSNTVSVQYRNSLRCNAELPADGPVEFYCDLDGDGTGNEAGDGEYIACNYLSWADGAAYLDWCGLRPLTELEYEKVCRGTSLPVPGEFAWGRTSVTGVPYSISDAGTGYETISSNYGTASGNANYGFIANVGIEGPMRVGIFSGHPDNMGRTTAGAGYYGAMELSGNLLERTVTIGNITGRSYTGLHGDGQLNTSGNADVLLWPGADATGSGFRGGDWYGNTTDMQVSVRCDAANTVSHRLHTYGFRGCRGVKPSGEGY